jgi:spectinomycin phosphotransferase
VLDAIAQLHQSTDVARPTAINDDLAIDGRDQLVTALGDLDSAWTGGPYAEPARALLRPLANDVHRVLRHYDELAAAVVEERERMVITHGEPHRGNTIATTSGLKLIDWDTVQIAPPERDLWSLAAEDPSIVADYAAMAGTITNRDSMELYRLRWDLTEVALFVADFRRGHDDTEDTRVAWSGLSHQLDPARAATPT